MGATHTVLEGTYRFLQIQTHTDSTNTAGPLAREEQGAGNTRKHRRWLHPPPTPGSGPGGAQRREVNPLFLVQVSCPRALLPLSTWALSMPWGPSLPGAPRFPYACSLMTATSPQLKRRRLLSRLWRQEAGGTRRISTAGFQCSLLKGLPRWPSLHTHLLVRLGRRRVSA